jgi:hypothetical protein
VFVLCLCVVVVSLGGNCIGDQGAAAIGAGLHGLLSLTLLKYVIHKGHQAPVKPDTQLQRMRATDHQPQESPIDIHRQQPALTAPVQHSTGPGTGVGDHHPTELDDQQGPQIGWYKVQTVLHTSLCVTVNKQPDGTV